MASAAAARVVAGGVAPKINVAARVASAKSPTSRRASAVARALRPTAAFVDVVESEPGTLLKPFEEGMQKSLLFGVSHMMNNHEAAEYILNSKPRSVVVETGLCKAHQERRGTVFNFSELFASIHMAGGAAEEALAFITRVAHQLRLEEQPLAGSPFWAQMKTQLPAEALVYAAAFAVEARLVFGDRPKSTTYRRLVSCPTLKELDETFAKQSARNYRLLVPPDHPVATLLPPDPATDAFERVCIAERDTILAHTIYEEAVLQGTPGAVVAVVGSDHLLGVERRWAEMVASGGKSKASAEEIEQLMTAPETTRENIGARLAIMQRLLGLRCTESLVADAFEALDADMNTLEGDEIIAFNATSEIYGAPRMLLAAAAEADDAAFDAAVGSATGVDFKKELEPMRAVRPANGGVGWSEEAIVWLRTTGAVDVSSLETPRTE
jgi:hypothetical protein